uniref:NADH-ubiquinone oxidoreductase chain 2 n=1 Tax=Cucujoidea sp. 35 KM-2017 TaxID=2219373 RepID=A0A346RFX2_9CUCU|nr:NADH dehydrogenase subunit 2 [Cucujoidea sp. 35 KM-2017]
MKLWKIMFLNIIIIGTLISISAISWFSMWMGLEINLMAVIPLIANNKNMYSSESALKYFIIQALASTVLLFSLILIMFNDEILQYNYKTLFILMMNSSLMSKMGAAPFHFWFPEIISGLNWFMTSVMLTWQKLAPMVIFMYNYKLMMFNITVIISSMIIGSVMSLNQSNLRKIFVYSSINHMGWMISAMMFNQSVWTNYFLIYNLMIFQLTLILFNQNIYSMNQIYSLFNNNKIMKLMFFMNFLSLGGLPPMIGFFPKWMTINSMLENKFMLSIFMVIVTLIMLFTYTRIMFNALMIKSPEFKLNTKNFKFISSTSIINALSLTLTPLAYFLT